MKILRTTAAGAAAAPATMGAVGGGEGDTTAAARGQWRHRSRRRCCRGRHRPHRRRRRLRPHARSRRTAGVAAANMARDNLLKRRSVRFRRQRRPGGSVRGCRQVIVESWRTCMAPDPQAKVRSGRALGLVGAAVGLATGIDAELIGRPLSTFEGRYATVSACAAQHSASIAPAWFTFQPCLQHLSR